MISVVHQSYSIRSSPEDVILGNDAIMKCSIPSFVSDFVSVVDWEDSEGVVLFPRDNQQLGKQIISQRFTYSWTIFTLLTLYTVYCILYLY